MNSLKDSGAGGAAEGEMPPSSLSGGAGSERRGMAFLIRWTGPFLALLPALLLPALLLASLPDRAIQGQHRSLIGFSEELLVFQRNLASLIERHEALSSMPDPARIQQQTLALDALLFALSDRSGREGKQDFEAGSLPAPVLEAVREVEAPLRHYQQSLQAGFNLAVEIGAPGRGGIRDDYARAGDAVEDLLERFDKPPMTLAFLRLQLLQTRALAGLAAGGESDEALVGQAAAEAKALEEAVAAAGLYASERSDMRQGLAEYRRQFSILGEKITQARQEKNDIRGLLFRADMAVSGLQVLVLQKLKAIPPTPGSGLHPALPEPLAGFGLMLALIPSWLLFVWLVYRAKRDGRAGQESGPSFSTAEQLREPVLSTGPEDGISARPGKTSPDHSLEPVSEADPGGDEETEAGPEEDATEPAPPPPIVRAAEIAARLAARHQGQGDKAGD